MERTSAQPLLQAVESSSDWLLEHYEHLHRHPELSMEEHDTAEYIEDVLQGLGLETQRIGETGVVAIIENGDGRVVLGRADMDALPVTEDTALEYASETPGVMHACGHDTHMAGLLGAVRTLTEHRDSWHGTFIALFQPSEEDASGARAMVADGLVDKTPKPDACFACHAMVGPAGQVSVKRGPTLSSADSMQITVFGRGAHGSMPHLSVDPVVLASSIVLRLQTIVARETEPGTFAVVTVGALHAGSSSNIIADRAELQLNVRTYDEKVRERVLAAIERIVRAECEAAGSPREPEFTYDDHYPVTDNDAVLHDLVRASFDAAFGDDSQTATPATASEDFCAIPEAFGTPYAYWFVGSTDRERYSDAEARGAVSTEIPGNHSPAFAPVAEPTVVRIAQSHVAAAMAVFGSAE